MVKLHKIIILLYTKNFNPKLHFIIAELYTYSSPYLPNNETRHISILSLIFLLTITISHHKIKVEKCSDAWRRFDVFIPFIFLSTSDIWVTNSAWMLMGTLHMVSPILMCVSSTFVMRVTYRHSFRSSGKTVAPCTTTIKIHALLTH